MIKKILLMLSLGVTFIIVLFIYSNRNKTKRNGFERIISRDKVLKQSQITLGKEQYSIIDVLQNTITINKSREPYKLLKISIDLNKKQSYELPLLAHKEKYRGLNTVAFRDNVSFILSGRTSFAYQIGQDGKSVKETKLDNQSFNHSEVVNANSFVFMSKFKLDSMNRRVLKKVNWQGRELNRYVPEKQIDGYFCTDAKFRYDVDSKLFVYMFYYRGTFVTLDTNLNIVYQAKTIDTVNWAKINLKIGKLQVTHSTPPNFVNKRFSIANQRVYIHSALKADNENDSDFKNKEIIDVYDLKNGRYIVSFCFPALGR